MKTVITGMGAVTPIGNTAAEYWDNLLAGKSGVSKIESFDASEFAVQIGAEVKNFDPSAIMSAAQLRKTDTFMQYAFSAAREAISHSGISIDPLRTGIVMGTAMSGIATAAYTQEALSRLSIRKVGPHFIPKILGNVAAATIAIEYSIKGPSLTVSTACASGGDAIFTADMLLKAGKADSILVVGAESIFCPLVVYSLSNALVLSRRNDAPELASRPFDRSRDGFVIGEGSGAIMLETERHALSRGAKIYGELLGCANTNNAYDITDPEPDAAAEILCMNQAIAQAGISLDDIDYVNAHGTGTIKGDAAEALAIKNVFPGSGPMVSSTKGATGHMMGAGGITEVIACIKAIESGFVPPTLNLNEPEFDINLVAGRNVKAQVNIAMSNSFGFGGQNSCIIVGKYGCTC